VCGKGVDSEVEILDDFNVIDEDAVIKW